jgi:aminobenzoyl-glutamate transport protein
MVQNYGMWPQAMARKFGLMKRPFYLRALDVVERVGNALPDPVSLFLIAIVIVIAASVVFSAMGTEVIHPGTQATVKVVNLLERAQVQRMFTDAVKNFTEFPPLGLVLVTMIGIAVAERGGFVTAVLRRTVHAVPRPLLTSALVFAGINSSLVADAGYVVLIPLGAVIFQSVGRHPLAGLSATFAGVAGGFSANLSITSLDPLLSGLTQSAAQLVDPTYVVNVDSNWYFMMASVFLLTVLCTVVCERFVEPRLPVVNTSADAVAHSVPLSATERKGMRWALLSFVVGLGIVAALTVPEGAVLRDEAGTVAPMQKSIVVIIMVLFLVAGIVYARVTGSVRSDKDVVAMANDGMGTMGSYIVLAFVMAQFISYFGWSNLGTVVAVNGAGALKGMGLEGPVLLVGFILVAACINLIMASASAKWAVMAPVFVPMFMLMGISAEGTQVAYRIGDSCTNMVAPLMGYLPLILVAMRRYDPKASMGTLFSLMLPYSLAMIVVWTVFFLAWVLMDMPLGPGVGLSH